MDRTVVVSATNVLAAGYQVIPIDRFTPTNEPAGALFAVARAVLRVLAFKLPAGAIAVVASEVPESWPELLRVQVAPLSSMLASLGFHVVPSSRELDLVASYAAAARAAGDDVIVVGRDKRF